MRLALSNVNLAPKLADLGLLERAQMFQNGDPFLNPLLNYLTHPKPTLHAGTQTKTTHQSVNSASHVRICMHACQKKACHIQSRAKQYLKRFSSAQTLHTHIRKANKHTPHTKNLRVYIL